MNQNEKPFRIRLHFILKKKKKSLPECFKKMYFYSVTLGFFFYTQLRKIHTLMSQKFFKNKILKHVLHSLCSHWFRYVKIFAHLLAWFWFEFLVTSIKILAMLWLQKIWLKHVVEFWGVSNLTKNFTEFVYQVRRA